MYMLSIIYPLSFIASSEYITFSTSMIEKNLALISYGMNLLIFCLLMFNCLCQSCMATVTVTEESLQDSRETGNNGGCVYSNVSISEDSIIGSIIYQFPTPVEEERRTQLILTEGNKDKRFGFHSNNGTLFLARYLDYGICNIYNLLLKAKGGTNTADIAVGFCYNITITIDDVVDWPPYFNDTCSWQKREKGIYEEFSPPIKGNTSFGRFKDVFGPSPPTIHSVNTMRLNNDKCALTFYVGDSSYTFGKLNVHECKDVVFSCTTKSLRKFELIYACELYNVSSLPAEIDGFISSTYPSKEMDKIILLTISYENFEKAVHGIHCYWLDHFGPIDIKLEALGCPHEKYGGNCQYDCICENGATCHTFNGACKCPLGWKGVACDVVHRSVKLTPKPVLSDYGGLFFILCRAFQMEKRINTYFKWFLNDKLLDSSDNNVIFVAGVQNSDMSKIMVRHLWDNYTGKYECQLHDELGAVYSDVTYAKISGCPPNKWGHKCENNCDCRNGSTCTRSNGCECVPGLKGIHCDEQCASWTFGINCSSNCLCEIPGTSSCDATDGKCQCNLGYCGQLCEMKCHCNSWEKALCNSTHACLCVAVASTKQNNYWTIVTITFSAVFVVVIGTTILILRMCIRNDYKRLRTEEPEIAALIKKELKQLNAWQVQDRHITKTGPVLGQGEFGQVHKGVLKQPDRNAHVEVAIKQLLPGLNNLQRNYLFCREIQCLIKLKGQPYIIDFKGFALRGDERVFLMEYAMNGNLNDHVRRLGETIPKVKGLELIQFLKCVTCGMQYMQEKGIVHRDLASRNILLCAESVAKISDFGLSRDISEKGVYENVPWAEGQVALPLKWMPPEFLKRGLFYFKSDVWSFGVLLWEVCSQGEYPYKELTGQEFIGKINRGEKLEKPKKCTREAYQVMMKCWEYPLQIRLSARQLTEEIKALEKGEGLFNDEDTVP